MLPGAPPQPVGVRQGRPADLHRLRRLRSRPITTVRLAIRRLDSELPVPAYAHPGDAGLDLLARTGVDLAPGQRALVPTGIAIAVPPGWVGLVHPRSGLAHRHGITTVNAPGTIDSGYRGEIQVNLINLDPHETFRIERGDRIAQLLVQSVATVEWDEVEALPSSVRGDNGHGSTGGFASSTSAHRGRARPPDTADG